MITMPRWVIAILVVPTILVVVLVGYLLIDSNRDDRKDHAEIARLQQALDTNRYNACIQRVKNDRLNRHIDLVMQGIVADELGRSEAAIRMELVQAVLTDPISADVPEGKGENECSRP